LLHQIKYFTRTIAHRSTDKSHDDHGIFDGKPHSPLATHHHYNYLPIFLQSKFGTCCIDSKSFLTSPVLQEIPTRISPPTSINTIVDLSDNDDNNHKPAKKLCYTPTNLEGNAAILPPLPHLNFPADFDYQPELAASMQKAEVTPANSQTVPSLVNLNDQHDILWPCDSCGTQEQNDFPFPVPMTSHLPQQWWLQPPS